MELKVLLKDPIVVHCFVEKSFMLMSVVIVMKSYSGVFIVQLRFNYEQDKVFWAWIFLILFSVCNKMIFSWTEPKF